MTSDARSTRLRRHADGHHPKTWKEEREQGDGQLVRPRHPPPDVVLLLDRGGGREGGVQQHPADGKQDGGDGSNDVVDDDDVDNDDDDDDNDGAAGEGSELQQVRADRIGLSVTPSISLLV